MGKEDLQHWLLKNLGFQKQYQDLICESVKNQFRILNNNKQPIILHDWNYLLFCSSLLAQSHNAECQEAALRIACACIENQAAELNHKDGAAVILSSLMNSPALKLAENRDTLRPNVFDRLPFTLAQDWIKRSVLNTIGLSNNKNILLNQFQKLVWDNAEESTWLSISAPTSSGKSFVVTQWVVEYLRRNSNVNVVYIVPTRALIREVQNEMEKIIHSEKLENVSVATLPSMASAAKNKSNLFIFTQERLQIFLSDIEEDFIFNLIIVDEAQKVGDGPRGILLEQAIDSAVHSNPSCKVFFASPMTENPEMLLDQSPAFVTSSCVKREDIMVSQNLIWATQVVGQPKKWEILFLHSGKTESLGQLELNSKPSEGKRLPFLAATLADGAGGNMIYSNGPGEAEKISKVLYLLNEERYYGNNLDEDLKILIDLVKKTIHPKYILANVLERGIAFHYGNMPLVIKSEIERLFSLNKIKYLVCTSTLIEGVNMSCQNIFIRGPRKGQGNPMSPNDFWNLAGRAGRWGKEFQGNIICVDADKAKVWKSGPPVGRGKYSIKRTTDEIIGQPEILISYIQDALSEKSVQNIPNLEYTFSFLTSSWIRNGSLNQSLWKNKTTEKVLKSLQVTIEDSMKRISVPREIILRNPGISPLAMERLLKYFQDRSLEPTKSIETLLPYPPEIEGSPSSYVKILLRINKYLSKNIFGNIARVNQLSMLIVNWMKGFPLSRIIQEREKYYIQRPKPYNLSVLIRQTLDDVETYVRFLAPKYLSCYNDILKYYLIESGNESYVERLSDPKLYLEFGASQKTQLSLMGIGLSRSTAISLSEIIVSDSLSERECISWLNENNWITEDMPEFNKREINQILAKYMPSE